MLMNVSLEGLHTVEDHALCIVDQSRCVFSRNNLSQMTTDKCGVGQGTIDILPDDALLCVFDFYIAQASGVEAWHTLVHVCRRWRILVFGSPRRLNLRIACTDETPVKEKLDVWPALPIVISGTIIKASPGLDNIKAALEHHDRVCQIKLFFSRCELEDIIASLEEPFPILTDLDLGAVAFYRPFNTDLSNFLGGSAQLRSLTLRGIRIPDFLNLLLCTPNLVILRIDGIRNSGPFLQDELVTGLSTLTRLEQLDLRFEFGRPRPDLEHRSLPLLTPAALPSLTALRARGDTENLEDFIARIDAPLLDHLCILFSYSALDRVIVLDTPHLLRFISRIPKLRAPEKANIGFNDGEFLTWINFFYSTRVSHRILRLEIFCIEPERQFPCLAQFYRSPLFPLHPLEYLCIGEGQFSQQRQRRHAENTRWLKLLQPFTAVKNLYLTKGFALHIAHALQDLVGEGVMEVLPTLEKVFIEQSQPSGPVHEVIKEFVAARQLAGHPIVFSWWGIKNAGQTSIIDTVSFRYQLFYFC